MKIDLKNFYIEIEFLFLIVIFISIFSFKFRSSMEYFYLCYLFIIFHELSHILIASILGKKLEKISLSLSGVNARFVKGKYITNYKINYFHEILIYIAGPASNLILALLFNNIKVIFEINIFLCLINLITIYPLDGYNILKNILNMTKIKNINIDKISKLSRLILVIISVIQLIVFKSISLVVFCIYLYILNLQYVKSSQKICL